MVGSLETFCVDNKYGVMAWIYFSLNAFSDGLNTLIIYYQVLEWYVMISVIYHQKGKSAEQI